MLKEKENVTNNDSDSDDETDNITREDNHIYFHSDITSKTIFKLCGLIRETEEYCHLLAFKLRVPEIPILLHLYSNGGAVLAAYTAIDVIKSSRVPVHSIIEGFTASAGTLLSVVCQKRYMRPHAYMLIHQLSSKMWGKMSELSDGYQNLNQLQTRLRQIYQEHTKMSKKRLNTLLKRDIYLDLATAKEYGLVDEVWS